MTDPAMTTTTPAPMPTRFRLPRTQSCQSKGETVGAGPPEVGVVMTSMILSRGS